MGDSTKYILVQLGKKNEYQEIIFATRAPYICVMCPHVEVSWTYFPPPVFLYLTPYLKLNEIWIYNYLFLVTDCEIQIDCQLDDRISAVPS